MTRGRVAFAGLLLALSAHSVSAAAPAPAPAARLSGYPLNPTTSRLIIQLQSAAAPELRAIDGAIELHFAKGVRVAAQHVPKLRQIAKIDVLPDADGDVLTIHFACDCVAADKHAATQLQLDIRPVQRATGAPTRQQPSTKETLELDRLRHVLEERLAALNGGGTQPQAKSGAPGAAKGAAPNGVAAAQNPPAPAVCPPHFVPPAGPPRGDFVALLKELRGKIAESQDSPAALTELAGFYLHRGLPGEARAVALQVQPGEGGEQLAAISGISRLLQRVAVDPAEGMPAISENCTTPDAALWRALAAASANDAEGIARNAAGAATMLLQVPEPLIQLMVFRLVDAAGDNLTTLQTLAGALRNTETGQAEDEAGRFLLQARIARLDGDIVEERAFLTRAAAYPHTVPGLSAKARLAALGVAQAGNETVLADIARTYRTEPVGQQAADAFAEHRLTLGDYAGAMAIADATAGPSRDRNRDSRGAALAARVLRILLLAPPESGVLPQPQGRLALYWRYEGYATPGLKGDDIRVGAARLMLAEDVPGSALDVLRQLSDATANTDPVRLLRATAEARAGDANAALAILRALPEGDERHRIASIALARLGQFADAAHELDGATASADVTRRAALLFAAKSWSDAATAYAGLLANTAIKGDARAAAAERYALALALSNGTPANDLPALPQRSSALVAIVTPPDSAKTTGDRLRTALDRANRIQQLFAAPPAHAQGS